MAISNFLEYRDRYLEIEDALSTLERQEDLNAFFFNRLVFECEKLQKQMLPLVKSPDADGSVYALQESIEKVHTRMLAFCSFPAIRLESTGEHSFELLDNKELIACDFRKEKLLFKLPNCDHFEIDQNYLYTLENNKFLFRNLKTGQPVSILPLSLGNLSKASLFHISQNHLFLQVTSSIYIISLNTFIPKTLGTIYVGKHKHIKEMGSDENYLHVRTDKHWQIWDLSDLKAIKRVKKYRVSGFTTEKKPSSLFRSLILGQKGTFHIGEIKIQFKDTPPIGTMEGAGMLSDFAEGCSKSNLFRLISLSPLHVLVHETGHVLPWLYFTGENPEKIVVSTSEIGGDTVHRPTPLRHWRRSTVLAAGPVVHMLFSSCQLITATAMEPYLPQPVTLLLQAGAIAQMTGELLYAYTSTISKNTGDFGQIAKISKTHLAVATVGLVTTCALGIFGAFKL